MALFRVDGVFISSDRRPFIVACILAYSEKLIIVKVVLGLGDMLTG
jgi:hypothetical protein